MLINGKNEVFMIDRDNTIFHIANLEFPFRKDPRIHLSNTLLDGVSWLPLIFIFLLSCSYHDMLASLWVLWPSDINWCLSVLRLSAHIGLQHKLAWMAQWQICLSGFNANFRTFNLVNRNVVLYWIQCLYCFSGQTPSINLAKTKVSTLKTNWSYQQMTLSKQHYSLGSFQPNNSSLHKGFWNS